MSQFFRSYLILSVIFLSVVPLRAQITDDLQPYDIGDDFAEPVNQRVIDSLIMVLSYAEEDASKVDVLNRLSDEFLSVDYEKSIEYSTMALNLAEELKYQEGVVRACTAIGHIYINYSLNYYKGLPMLTRALEVAESMDDQSEVMKVYRQFAYLNYLLGAYDKAMDFNLRALKISEEMKLYEERSEMYATIGDLYLEMGDTSKGLEYYEQVQIIESEHDYKQATGEVLVSLGRYHELLGKYARAIYFYKRALRLFAELNAVRMSAYVHSLLSSVYYKMKDYNIAVEQGEAGLKMAERYNLKKERLDNYLALATVYEETGELERSLLLYKQYTNLKDSVLTSRMAQQTEVFQTNFEKVIEETEIEKLKNEEKNRELEVRNHELMRNLAIGASAGALLIAFLLFMRFRYISQVNVKLRKQRSDLVELSLVASKTTNSIVILDKNVRVLWVNDAFQEITGLNMQDVIGMHPFDFPDAPILTDEEKLEINRLYKAAIPFTREARTRTPDGTDNWVSMNVTPVFDDNGDLIKYISVATNITELVKLEEQYEHLVEGSSEAIYEIDLNGQFYFVNDQLASLTGYTKEELKEKYYTELIREDFIQKVKKIYTDQFYKKEKSTYVEFPLISKDGREYWLGQNAQLSFDPHSGEILGYQVIARDITDKVAAEKSLKTARDNARLLSEIGKQITSSLSVPDIIDRVYENINRLMDANIFGIAIYDGEAKELRFPALIENNEKMGDVAFDINDNQRLGVLCFKKEQEIVINDHLKEIGNYLNTDKVVAPVAGELPESTVYLPLKAKDHLIGVITVQSFQKNAYDEYKVDIVRSIASFASIAIDNASLYQDMEERVAARTKEVRKQKEELEVNYANTKTLSDIGLIISSTLNFDEVFETVHENVMRMMDAEIFGVRLYDEKKKQVIYKYEIEGGVRDPEIIIPMSDENNYTVWCVKNRKKIIINNNDVDYKKYVDSVVVPSGKRPYSLLFYPMIVDQKVIGVITVQSFKKDAYQNYHLDLLKTLSSYVGTALDNAELYATLEEKVRVRTEEVRQKNKDITASINYARRIQHGMLPSKNFMDQLLPQTFVLFKPRDIVSGDFYWMDRNRAKILMAVVDCTGHGVPGAMMSIIGRNLLDQAVNEKGLTMPSQILNFLQVGLMVAFGQTENERTDVFDGMDLAVCSIDLKAGKLEFAGANNPMYLVRDGELEMIKADKMGVSAQYQAQTSYTNVEMDIQDGDRIYLFSDGYPDQFGGDRNKKFTYKRFADVLLENHQKPMEEQCQILDDIIEEWKGAREQTDDICVMGAELYVSRDSEA